MAKCKNCGIELASRKERVFSRAERGLCGECVMEENITNNEVHNANDGGC